MSCSAWEKRYFIPATWRLDPTVIRIALANLVDNALKYSDNEQVTVRVRQNSDALSIRGKNNGYGISADEADLTVFELLIPGG